MSTPSPKNPQVLCRLRRRYAHVLTHIDMACRDADSPLGDEHLWQVLARTASPAWAAADAMLQTARLSINRLNRDENRPLGAIGRALAASEINAAEAALALAQSRFTIIDERLRAMRGLQMLLNDVKRRYGTLERSQEATEAVFAMTLDAERAAPSLATARPKSRLFSRLFRQGRFCGSDQKSLRAGLPAAR